GDASERAHRYRVTPRLRGENVEVWTHAFDAGTSQALDAGRYVRGVEAFDMLTSPGRDLILVNRFRPGWHDHSPIYVDVRIAGERAGTWRHAPGGPVGAGWNAPDGDGRWAKTRAADIYRGPGVIRPGARLQVELGAGPIPTTVTRTLRVRDRLGQVLFET